MQLARSILMPRLSLLRFSLRLREGLELSRQRRALARLDARALDDIGVSRSQAEAEARRPPWDAPDSWR